MKYGPFDVSWRAEAESVRLGCILGPGLPHIRLTANGTEPLTQDIDGPLPDKGLGLIVFGDFGGGHKLELRHEAMRGTFGAVLARQRLEKGLSISRLAQYASMSTSMIERLERDQWQPSIRTVVRLADALGVSLEVFRRVLWLD